MEKHCASISRRSTTSGFPTCTKLGWPPSLDGNPQCRNGFSHGRSARAAWDHLPCCASRTGAAAHCHVCALKGAGFGKNNTHIDVEVSPVEILQAPLARGCRNWRGRYGPHIRRKLSEAGATHIMLGSTTLASSQESWGLSACQPARAHRRRLSSARAV